jgi:hypothetical protein
MAGRGAHYLRLGIARRLGRGRLGTSLALVDKRNASASPLRFERGPMLCAPISDALRSNSLIRADNTIDGMTLKQLSTGIL